MSSPLQPSSKGSEERSQQGCLNYNYSEHKEIRNELEDKVQKLILILLSSLRKINTIGNTPEFSRNPTLSTVDDLIKRIDLVRALAVQNLKTLQVELQEKVSTQNKTDDALDTLIEIPLIDLMKEENKTRPFQIRIKRLTGNYGEAMKAFNRRRQQQTCVKVIKIIVFMNDFNDTEHKELRNELENKVQKLILILINSLRKINTIGLTPKFRHNSTLSIVDNLIKRVDLVRALTAQNLKSLQGELQELQEKVSTQIETTDDAPDDDVMIVETIPLIDLTTEKNKTRPFQIRIERLTGNYEEALKAFNRRQQQTGNKDRK